MTVGNLTVRRLLEIDDALSERDRYVVQSVGKFSLISGEQLRQLFFSEAASTASSKRTTQHALRRLTSQGLLARLKRRIGGVRSGSSGHIYCLGPAGQRLAQIWNEQPAARARRPYEPGEPFIRHRLACTQLFVDLALADADGHLVLERFDAEPDCWRSRVGPFGKPLTLKPDAYAEVGVGRRRLHWFAEVDLATESLTVIARKGRAYLDHYRSGAEPDVMPRVIWVVPTEKRCQQVRAVLHGLPEPSNQLHVVVTANQTIQTMKGESL